MLVDFNKIKLSKKQRYELTHIIDNQYRLAYLCSFLGQKPYEYYNDNWATVSQLEELKRNRSRLKYKLDPLKYLMDSLKIKLIYKKIRLTI